MEVRRPWCGGRCMLGWRGKVQLKNRAGCPCFLLPLTERAQGEGGGAGDEVKQ